MVSKQQKQLTSMAVLVEASGPDPRQVKAAAALSHLAENGTTRLSASGAAQLCKGKQEGKCSLNKGICRHLAP